MSQSRVLPAPTILVLQNMFGAAALGAAVAAAAGVELAAVADWTSVLITTALAMVMAAAALRTCGRITGADLDVGADMAVAARVSIVGMDLSVLFGASDDRAWRRVARRSSRRLAGRRTNALIHADLLRHLRRPSTFILAATTAAVACALGGSTASSIASAWAQLVAVFVAAVMFSAGLPELSNNPELRGMIGGDDRALRRPLLVVPVCAATAAGLLTAPLVNWSIAALAIVVIGACTAAYRLRTRPRTAYNGLILATGVGPLPIDLIRQKLRGPDVLILTAILLAMIV